MLQEQPGWDESLLYNKIMGAAATANTFYPFDYGMEKPLEILNYFLTKLSDISFPQLSLDERASLTSSIVQALALFSNPKITAEQKAEGLLNIYLLALVASHKIQHQFGFVTPFWAKVPSRMEGAVLGWTLGWHNREKEAELRNRIVDFCLAHGCDLANRRI